MKTRFVAMLALPFALFVTGCGADCESLCEDAKECDGASGDGDCAKACEDAESAADAAGCLDKFEDCNDSIDDVCATEPTSECADYATCMMDAATP